MFGKSVFINQLERPRRILQLIRTGRIDVIELSRIGVILRKLVGRHIIIPQPFFPEGFDLIDVRYVYPGSYIDGFRLLYPFDG